jgi:tetratricopeptide (TPR) repeat protein
MVMSSSAADDLRLRGNHEFAGGRYDAALSLYTAALELSASASSDQQRCILLCNRSATYFQQGEYELSEQDALKAWELSGERNVKAAYRLAKTQIALKRLEDAKETIQKSLKVVEQGDEPSGDGNGAPTSERKALEDLWKEVLSVAYDSKQAEPRKPETSIRFAQRPVSIREFTKHRALGYGNFSEVVVVQHKETKEEFALKIITKKQAADLAKRQHPNVYNEIQMERRALLERLPPHPYCVRMYHAFQDYNALYYLMDLHVGWSDLWSELQWTVADHGEAKKHMVGSHRSQAVRWIFQMVDALEHMHKHGIVHRDLKTENVLLSARGHVVVIDFGTAKDLLETDVNGPECELLLFALNCVLHFICCFWLYL